MLIVIEGVDGAGKRTLTSGLRATSRPPGIRWPPWPSPIRTFQCPPTSRPKPCTEGRGDLAESVYAMAVLFAMDRAGARAEIERPDGGILRCSSSTATSPPTPPTAPQAQLHQDVDGDVVG